MVDTKLNIDGEDTGIKLKLDLNSLIQMLAAAAVIGICGLLLHANSTLSTVVTNQTVQQYKLDDMAKKMDGYASREDIASLQKQIDNCFTNDKAAQMVKIRDMELDEIRARLPAQKH